MDKQWQDIHIIYDDCIGYNEKNVIQHNIRQVNINSVITDDLFIKINVVDTKGKKNTIIVPKLHGVKVVFD